MQEPHKDMKTQTSIRSLRPVCHPKLRRGASLVAQLVKNMPANAGDMGSIPGLGRPLGEGNDNLLQYSCLENLIDKGAWWATVYGVTRVRHG